jgi:hypothetical protein
MFMSGLGGVGGAGHDLISSCSSISYSGDDADCPMLLEDGKIGFEGIKDLLRKHGHLSVI